MIEDNNINEFLRRCSLQRDQLFCRRLKDRFNEHRRTIDNPNNKFKPTTAAEHFHPHRKSLFQPRLHP